MPTQREVDRWLDDLVRIGLVKKATRNGVEVFYLDMSYVERAEELMKDGMEIRAAYWRAIEERCPSLADEDILRLVAECVHEKKALSQDSKRNIPRGPPRWGEAG